MKYWIQKTGFFLLISSAIILFVLNDLKPIVFYVLFASTLILSFILEKLCPYESNWNDDKKDYKEDALYAISTILISPLAKIITTYTVIYFGLNILPSNNFWQSQATWFQITIGLLISGFLPYWYHRLSHSKSAFLWKIHSIHHSPEKLYWLNGFRFHPINAFMNALLSLTPLLVLGFPKDTILLVGFINNYVSILNHTNIDFQLGSFNYIFNMNELHRWHHSKKIEEGNNNFSSGALIIWDLVFGTYFFSKRKIITDELGLYNESKISFPYHTIRKQLCFPFCKFSIMLTLFSISISTSFTIPNKDDSIVGIWLTRGKEPAKVQIYKSGQKYFGEIIWLKEPFINGKPKMDINNQKISNQNHPIIGLQILQNFSYNSETSNWENGTVYDPKCGDTYKCIIKRDGKTLKVKAFIGFSVFGKTETWELVEQ